MFFGFVKGAHDNKTNKNQVHYRGQKVLESVEEIGLTSCVDSSNIVLRRKIIALHGVSVTFRLRIGT